MIASMSFPVSESSACSVMEVTRMPRLCSIDLKATACSRLRVKRENFHTRISSTGASGPIASSSYTLEGGGYVPYILGAPDFVNRSFSVNRQDH